MSISALRSSWAVCGRGASPPGPASSCRTTLAMAQIASPGLEARPSRTAARVPNEALPGRRRAAAAGSKRGEQGSSGEPSEVAAQRDSASFARSSRFHAASSTSSAASEGSSASSRVASKRPALASSSSEALFCSSSLCFFICFCSLFPPPLACPGTAFFPQPLACSGAACCATFLGASSCFGATFSFIAPLSSCGLAAAVRGLLSKKRSLGGVSAGAAAAPPPGAFGGDSIIADAWAGRVADRGRLPTMAIGC
mmetsp:Transcript_61295/g.179758  ORF Transcript_61295/g.179758 Transcript_61295/m.179758 type:complete len:254 (-) Transcript_61295:72-833(-)